MIRYYLLAVALLLFPVLPAQAQEGRQEPKVTLSLRDIPLRSAIDLLFSGTTYQYAIAPEVGNPLITLNVKDIPFERALQTLVRLAKAQVPGLNYTFDRPRSGSDGVYLFRVEPAPSPPERVSLTQKIPLNFTRAEDLLAQLNQGLIPPDLEVVQPVPVDNSLIVRGPQQSIDQLKMIVRYWDVPGRALAVRASIQGPGAAGRPLDFQAMARTMNRRDVTLDEQTQVGGQIARMKVKVRPFIQGDGNVQAESDWDISVPVDGGPRGPIRLVKRLNTVTRLQPGQGAAVGEVDLSPWGGRGVVRLWLRVDLLAEPTGRVTYGPGGERLGRVQLVGDAPYVDLFSLTDDLGGLPRFDPTSGTYTLAPVPRARQDNQYVEPSTAGPFRFLVDGKILSTRVILKLGGPMEGGPLRSGTGGIPFLPLEDLARSLGARVRFDPAHDAYHLVGGRSLPPLNATGR